MFSPTDEKTPYEQGENRTVIRFSQQPRYRQFIDFLNVCRHGLSLKEYYWIYCELYFQLRSVKDSILHGNVNHHREGIYTSFKLKLSAFTEVVQWIEALTFTEFVLFCALQIPWPPMTFSSLSRPLLQWSLSKSFKIFLVLGYFLTLNRNKLWCSPKCVAFSLFDYFCLSYIVLALSSAVTKPHNKTLIFHDFQGPIIKFNDFPGLEKGNS